MDYFFQICDLFSLKETLLIVLRFVRDSEISPFRSGRFLFLQKMTIRIK